MAKYLPSSAAARLIFLRPLFSQVEKSNYFDQNIYSWSNLSKIRKKTIKK